MDRHRIKIKRLEKLCMRTLSEALLFHIKDPRLIDSSITIDRVEIDDEISSACIFFTAGEEANKNKLIKALYSSAPFLLSLLKEKVRIRSLPSLKFFYDKKAEQARDVVDLIETLSKKSKESSKGENNDAI